MKTQDSVNTLLERIKDGLTAEECADMGVWALEDAIAAERDETITVLNSASAFLTGPARMLVDSSDANRVLSPELEGVIADVEGLRAKMDPNA